MVAARPAVAKRFRYRQEPVTTRPRAGRRPRTRRRPRRPAHVAALELVEDVAQPSDQLVLSLGRQSQPETRGGERRRRGMSSISAKNTCSAHVDQASRIDVRGIDPPRQPGRPVRPLARSAGATAHRLGDQEARVDQRAHVVQRVRGGSRSRSAISLLVRAGSSTNRMIRSRIGDASARISCKVAGRRPSDCSGMEPV